MPSAEAVIAEHQQFAAWLRAHIDPCYDTSQLSPDQAADRIAAWMSQRPIALLTFWIDLPNQKVRRY